MESGTAPPKVVELHFATLRRLHVDYTSGCVCMCVCGRVAGCVWIRVFGCECKFAMCVCM